eukprot:GAHX01001144.1.p1 GENE.GAHX01001144.1~~GAHX01001144.1.p1  ORF type:complete len:348 (-),score=48.16 GAHX01001144.1:41-1084(-)
MSTLIVVIFSLLGVLFTTSTIVSYTMARTDPSLKTKAHGAFFTVFTLTTLYGVIASLYMQTKTSFREFKITNSKVLKDTHFDEALLEPLRQSSELNLAIVLASSYFVEIFVICNTLLKDLLDFINRKKYLKTKKAKLHSLTTSKSPIISNKQPRVKSKAPKEGLNKVQINLKANIVFCLSYVVLACLISAIYIVRKKSTGTTGNIIELLKILSGLNKFILLLVLLLIFNILVFLLKYNRNKLTYKDPEYYVLRSIDLCMVYLVFNVLLVVKFTEITNFEYGVDEKNTSASERILVDIIGTRDWMFLFVISRGVFYITYITLKCVCAPIVEIINKMKMNIIEQEKQRN